MNKKSRFMSLLLAFLMCASFAACGAPSDSDTETNDTGADTASDVQETEDTDAVMYTDLPSGDFEGQSFNILVPTHVEREFVGDIAGDIIEESVYKRNLAVEEALNVKINPVLTAGLWDDQSNFLTTVKSSVMANDNAYQLISGYAAYITTLAADGVLANWFDTKNVNFEKPWWNNDVVEEMNVCGSLYYVTGDLSLTSLQYLFCLFFNKDLVNDYSLEDPYNLVKSGKWTLDTVKAYTAAVEHDLNGDSIMNENDQFGYISDDSNYISGYQAAFDASITIKDSDGVPRLAIESEDFINKFTQLYEFLRNTTSTYLANMSTSFNGVNTVTTKMFTESRALIMADMLGNAETLRDVDVDFGILPYPKFDETQKDYHTTSWDAYTLFCIPQTADLSFTGAVVENLAANSYKTVVPAFYETALKTKYARDVESSEMIDIIRKGATYNFGTVNSVHCGSCGHTFRSLIQGNNPNIASYIAANIKSMTKALDNFVLKSYLS